MSRSTVTAFAALTLLAPIVSAHDPRLHAGNAITGEIVSVTADSLQLKTRSDTVTVKFSSKTTFEHDKKTVDKNTRARG